MVVTRPVQPLAPILSGGMLAALPLLSVERSTAIVEALERAGSTEELDQLRSWAHYYFADGDVGTFVDAVIELAGITGPEEMEA